MKKDVFVGYIVPNGPVNTRAGWYAIGVSKGEDAPPQYSYLELDRYIELQAELDKIINWEETDAKADTE